MDTVDYRLIDKIREYALATNSINKPTSEDDEQLFNQIIKKENISNKALNLKDLRKLATEIKAGEIKACQEFYKEVAEEMGIQCVDTESQLLDEITIPDKSAEETGVQCIDTQNQIDEEVNEINSSLNRAHLDQIQNMEYNIEQLQEIEDNNEKSQGVENDMTTDNETMPIPKISLSDQSIQRLKGISDELINKITEVIKYSKDTMGDTAKQQPVKTEVMDSNVEYTEEDRNKEVMGPRFNRIKDAATLGMNIIYRGVPGCGKTYMANCDAKALIGKETSNRILQIDFTENLDYSDTMVGLRQSENGKWKYIKGEIVEFCDFAAQYINLRFVLIINELTRANTEAVLGQMFTAMENKYRGIEFKLDNGDKFICPKNLIILATMNGTDKGVKKLDKATEERFYIIDVKPLWEEWATDEYEFDELAIRLGVRTGTDEHAIIKELCIEVASINDNFDGGGILTADNQIGQRQLLQFVGQTDINGNKIEYTKATLKIIIEQIISRAKPMVDMCNVIEDNINKLNKLMVKCNGQRQ